MDANSTTLGGLHPLGADRYGGMLAVAVTGTISVTLTLLFLSYAAVCLYQHVHSTPQQRSALESHDPQFSRRNTFFASDFGLLLLNLVMSGNSLLMEKLDKGGQRLQVLTILTRRRVAIL